MKSNEITEMLRPKIQEATQALSLGIVGDVLEDSLLAEVIRKVYDDKRIVELIKKNVPKRPATEVKILPEKKVEDIGLHHRQLGEVFSSVQCGNVCLVGPAGSGKTTLASQVAHLLSVNFFFTGAISNEYKLTGFVDANGKLVRTPFREAYEHGGLFLFDEIDGSNPAAVLAFNNALANGSMDFPDKNVAAHEDFKCIAAANTYWGGADMTYIGRNQLDGASLDRFVMIKFDYDETLERNMCNNDTFVTQVQRYRRSVQKNKIQHVISPRASVMGSKLLEAGLSKEFVEASVLFKGLPAETIKKIKSGA